MNKQLSTTTNSNAITLLELLFTVDLRIKIYKSHYLFLKKFSDSSMHENVLFDGLDHRDSLSPHFSDEFVKRKVGSQFSGSQKTPNKIDRANRACAAATRRTMNLKRSVIIFTTLLYRYTVNSGDL